MFAAIKQSFSNLFSGSSKQDSFSMEQRTRALLIQTQRNRAAGKQMQQRAHRPMQAATRQKTPLATAQMQRTTTQKITNKPVAKPSSAASLTNLNSDIF